MYRNGASCYPYAYPASPSDNADAETFIYPLGKGCPMDRRAFMTFVSLGLLADYLPMAIAASAEPKFTLAKARADGFIAVGTVNELKTKGVIKAPQFPGKPLLIIRNPQDSSKVIAVSSSCTHKGCEVDWKAKNNQFVCPCHGAKFSSDGNVTKEPANRPLPSFKAKIEGNLVLVKSS
jgi:cytochrome b6-f complex iron-sulfur subunit